MRPGGAGRGGRCYGYARVSSAEQALGTSLQDQQNAIKAYAAARGLKIDRFFVEAESAVHEKFERREQIQLLMRELREGDLILVDKLDRWSRDIEWTYRSMREIGEARARVYFVGEQLDPTTPEGDSMLSMRAMFAREEHKRIRLRTVGTRKVLRDRGLYAEGLPPLGYKRSLPKGSKGIAKNILKIDDAGAVIVRDIYRRCIAGQSVNKIVTYLTKTKKQRSWDNKLVGKILRNRVYLGEVLDSRSVWIRGQHAPLIEVETFTRAQAGLASRRLNGRKPTEVSLTSTWLLRKLAVCANCGAKITSAYGGGFIGCTDYIFYYRCWKSCGARYIPQKAQDQAIEEMVIARLIELRQLLAIDPKAPARPVRPAVDFAEKKEKLVRRRARFLEAWDEELMTKDELRAALAKVDAARMAIESQEAAATRSSPLFDKKVRAEMLKLVANMRLGWRAFSPKERRDTIADLIVEIRLARDKRPVVQWKTVEELAADLHPER